MFEIECKDGETVILSTKKTEIRFNVTEETVDAKIEVGKIVGPGEFEIGDVAIRGIPVGKEQTIYDAVVSGTHIGIIGGVDDAKALDELGVSDVLCTSSTRAVREIEPKIVIATGNVDGMVTELKLTPWAEKKLKVKSRESLPAALEVVALA